MYQEKYRIEFSGDLVGHFSYNDVVRAVADLLHHSLEKTRELFDGKCRNIATGLLEHEAIAYYEIMYDLGALCRIKIIMDKDSFKTGLIPVKEGEAALLSNVEQIEFKRDIFDPVFCSAPHDVAIFLQKGKKYGKITSLRWIFSTTFSILLAIPLILTVQYLFISFCTSLTNNINIVSIFSTLLFFVLCLILPSLLQPMRHFQVALDDNQCQFVLRQKRQLLVLKQLFSGREMIDNKYYTFFHKSFSRQYDCLDHSGNILYRAEKQLGDEDAVYDAAETLSEELIDIGALTYINDIYTFLRTLNIESLKKNRLKVKANRSRLRVVIKDKKETLVGTFILDSHSTLTLAKPLSDAGKLNLIIALCLTISEA